MVEALSSNSSTTKKKKSQKKNEKPGEIQYESHQHMASEAQRAWSLFFQQKKVCILTFS
jgi:hypothetical protein